MAQKSVAMRASEVDVSKLTFSDVKSMTSGAKMVYVNLNGGSLYVQTPELETPFDSVFYPDGSDSQGKIPVNVSLRGFDQDKKTKEFHDLLQRMDTLIKEKCMENSVAWHKKPKMSMETVESLYTNMVKLSTDPETGEPNGKYPPQFRFKLSKRNDTWECRVFDETKTEIESPDMESLLKRGSKIKALLKCTAIWIAGGKFGCSWKAEQLIVNTPKSLDDYAFRSDDEDDEGDSEGKTQEVEFVEDSSEEEEEDDEDEEEEEVVEKPKSKRGRKSKK